MSDLGLRYGEEFRPIRELSAGAGQSAGRVVLSDAVSPRAGEYALHPVLFDGALQVFSAGAATVEGRQARMKLPVGFRRILFLGSPGPSSRVCAKVREFSDDFLEGDITLYNEARKTLRAGGWIPGHQPFRRGPLCRARRHTRFDISRRLAAAA